MNKPLPPGIVAAQQRAAEERGDPKPIEQYAAGIDTSLGDVALRTALDKLVDKHISKTVEEAVKAQTDAERLEDDALMAHIKSLGLLREPKPMPLPALKVTFTAHNTQHTWGFACWNYFQDTVGSHKIQGKLPRCYENPNRNDIAFWWDDVADCNDWIVWARAERTNGLNKYPNIQIYIDIEL
jgi:hypothetical protein